MFDNKAYCKNYNKIHKSDIAEQRRKHRQDDPESHLRYLEITREWYKQLKIEVLIHYGGGKLACVQCGFDDIRALSIDHINGDGNKHRKQINHSQVRSRGGGSTYSWLRKNNYPDGFQTLCFNCQMIKKMENKEYYIPKPRII